MTTSAPTTRALPRWIVVLAVVAGIAVLISVVAGFGGFAERTDRLVRVDPRAEVVSGPLVMTYSTAVAYRTKTLDDTAIWEVRLSGTVRSTDPTTQLVSSLTPFLYAGTTAAGANGRRVLVPLENCKIGDRLGRTYESGYITPGLPPVPVEWIFRLPVDTALNQVLRVVIRQREWSDSYVVKTGEFQWNVTSQSFELAVPLTIVTAPR